MARRIVTEEVADDRVAPVVHRGAYNEVGNIISVVIGIIELLLAFRLVFLIFGANPNNSFVNFIYTVSGWLVRPFEGIFGTPVLGKAAFDPATLIALAVYAAIGWLLVRLVTPADTRPVDPV